MYIHEAQYVIPPSDSVKEPFCRLAFWGSFFLFFFCFVSALENSCARRIVLIYGNAHGHLK